jgi:aminopeptidase N
VIGFPVLTVTEEVDQITVKQSRFLSTGDVKPEEDTTTWWVPTMLNEEAFTASTEKVIALTDKETVIKGLDATYYKLNSSQNGFYRVNYPADKLTKLGEMREKLSVSDRVGLIADAAAMSFAGLATTAGLLGFLAGLKSEQSYLVWAEIVEQLGKLRSICAESSEEIRDGLNKFTLELVSQTVDRLGWEFGPDEDFLTGRLRALAISTAGSVGHKEVIAEALRRFNTYKSGDKPVIHPNLRLAIFRIAVAEGGEEELDTVIKEYMCTTAIDGREICLASLGRARKPELIKKVLEFMLSDKVKVQDKHTPAISLSNNSEARYALWEFIRDNWDIIYKQMSGNMVVLDRFLKNSLNKFASRKALEEIEEFFKDKDNTGYDKGLAVVKDSILGNVGFLERDSEKVKEWLVANGYN